MTFSLVIERDRFLEPLLRVAAVVEKKQTMPILGNILLLYCLMMFNYLSLPGLIDFCIVMYALMDFCFIGHFMNYSN